MSKFTRIGESKPGPLEILSVCIRREQDENPDLSHLGEYSDTPGPDAIDRGSSTDRYRYFNPAMTGDETGYPDSPLQDYERMEAYECGDWYMLGIRVEARIRNPETCVVHEISSGGLWGIESDSATGSEGADNGYLGDIERQELQALAVELLALGIPRATINTAFEHVKRG